MIKLKVNADNGPVLIFGLSARNITLLQAGKPIKIDLAELGMTGKLMLFAGATEDSMMEELESAGLLPAARASTGNPS